MKQLLLFCAVLFLHLYSCQLKMDSTVILYSKNSLIYPSMSNSCYGSGDYSKKYEPQNMLFVTEVSECKNYSSTKDIIGFYFDGKKYYMVDDVNDKNAFFVSGKRRQLSDLKNKFKNFSQAEIDSIDSWSKRLSEAYMRQLRKEASDKVFSKEKNGIAILAAHPTEEYSFTGAKFKILNFSRKTIKYITFNFYGKNAVNDRVGKNVSRKGIGPVESSATGSWLFDDVWLTDIVQSMKLLSVNIIYMDGTTRAVTITDNHWLDEEDLDHLDRLLE